MKLLKLMECLQYDQKICLYSRGGMILYNGDVHGFYDPKTLSDFRFFKIDNVSAENNNINIIAHDYRSKY